MSVRMTRAARRLMTPFFASLALLCAQLVHLPSIQSANGRQTIASASFNAAVVARSSGSASLATAERPAPPPTKSFPSLDAVLAGELLLVHGLLATNAPGTDPILLSANTASLAYRARAPPTATSFANSIPIK